MALEDFDYFKALKQISNDCMIVVPRYENEIDQYSESESEDELSEIESTEKAQNAVQKKRISQFVLDEEALLKRNVILERVKKFIPPKVPKITLKRLNGSLRTAFARSQRRPRQGISVSSSHYYKSETSSSSTKIVLTLQKPDTIAVDGEQQANVEDDCSEEFASDSSAKENVSENNDSSQRQEVIPEESIILDECSSAKENVGEKNNTPKKQDVISEKSVSLDENSSPQERIPENDDALELPDLDIITTVICKSNIPTKDIISPKIENTESNDDRTEEPKDIDEVPIIPIDCGCSHIKTEPVLIENQNRSPDDELPIEVNAQIESAPVPSGGTFHAGKIPVQWQLATESESTNRIGKIRIKRIADLMSSSVPPIKSKKKPTWHSPCRPIGGGQVDKSSGSKTSEVPLNSSHFQAEVPIIDTQTRQGVLQKQPSPYPDPVSSVIEAYHNELSTQKQSNSVLSQLLTEPKKKQSSPKNPKSTKVRLPKSLPEGLSISAVRAQLPTSTPITPALEHSRNAPQLPQSYFTTNHMRQIPRNPQHIAQTASSGYSPVSPTQHIQSSAPNSPDQYFSEFGQALFSQAKSMQVGSYTSVQQRQIYHQYQGQQQSEFSALPQPLQPRSTTCDQQQFLTMAQPTTYHQQQLHAQIPPMVQQPRQATYQQQQQITRALPRLQPKPTEIEQLQQKFSGNCVTMPQSQSDWLRLQQQSQNTPIVQSQRPLPRGQQPVQSHANTPIVQSQRPLPQGQQPVQSHTIQNQKQWQQQQCGRMQPPPYPQQPFLNTPQISSQTSEYGARAMNTHLATSSGHSPPAANTPPAALSQVQGLISNCSNPGSNNYRISGQTSVACPLHSQTFAQQNNSYTMNREPAYGYENTANVRSNGHAFADNNSYPTNAYHQNASTLQLSISSTVESTWSPQSSINNPTEMDIQNYANVYLKDFFEHAAAGNQRTDNFN